MRVSDCDAPGCDVRQVTIPSEDPMGFSGTVSDVRVAGKVTARWWACTQEHVAPAIFQALADEWDNQS